MIKDNLFIEILLLVGKDIKFKQLSSPLHIWLHVLCVCNMV